jgi:hypothetical protein
MLYYYYYFEKINLSLIKTRVYNKPPYRYIQDTSKKCIPHLSQKLRPLQTKMLQIRPIQTK